MKKTFNTFYDFTPAQIEDFDAIQHMSYDVNAIHHFMQSSLHTTDHDDIVRFGTLLQSIVLLINTYIHEEENFENPKDCVEDN